MEFICLQSEIRQILSFAENVVSTRSTIPILSNILIETDENNINLSATDLEIGFSSKVPAEIISGGSITLNAKKLSDIVKSFNNIPLRFNLKNDKVKIKADDPNIKTNFTLQGIPKDDFPKIPIFVEHNVFRLKELAFREIIRKTIPAASTDESRFFLNGMLFEKIDETLNFVATDGKRLAVIEHKLDTEDKEIEDFKIIVPAKVLNELSKILDGKSSDDEDEDCLISITETKVFFKIGTTEIFSNLFDGNFPSYKEVVPDKSIQNIALVDRINLFDAIKRVSIMIDNRISLVRLDFVDNSLNIYGSNSELGEAKDEITLENEIGKISIAFNYNYIIDAIREVEPKDIEIYLTEHSKPILIQGKDQDNYFSVIMPMKLPEED